MMSQKGLSQDKVNTIIQLCLDHGWHEEQEPNAYLYKKFVCGNSNIKIYTSKRGYSLVCNTEILLQEVLQGKLPPNAPTAKEIIIDDAGVGCPIGGIAIGYQICSTQPKAELDALAVDFIDVKFFQSPLFEQKAYLDEVATKIIARIGVYSPKEWSIRICTGYVFTKARESLVNLGFIVSTGQITGTLQNFVENTFWGYLTRVCNISQKPLFTPRNKTEYKMLFGSLLHYIQEHPEVKPYCKTGWNFFKELKGIGRNGIAERT
jgi:hypothetical protein